MFGKNANPSENIIPGKTQLMLLRCQAYLMATHLQAMDSILVKPFVHPDSSIWPVAQVPITLRRSWPLHHSTGGGGSLQNCFGLSFRLGLAFCCALTLRLGSWQAGWWPVTEILGKFILLVLSMFFRIMIILIRHVCGIIIWLGHLCFGYFCFLASRFLRSGYFLLFSGVTGPGAFFEEACEGAGGCTSSSDSSVMSRTTMQLVQPVALWHRLKLRLT